MFPTPLGHESCLSGFQLRTVTESHEASESAGNIIECGTRSDSSRFVEGDHPATLDVRQNSTFKNNPPQNKFSETSPL